MSVPDSNKMMPELDMHNYEPQGLDAYQRGLREQPVENGTVPKTEGKDSND